VTRSTYQHDVVIVPDVRFGNEFEELLRADGLLIKIIRPGFSPGPNRPDRTLLGEQRWSNVIGTSGTMSELEQWANQYADWIAGGDPVVVDQAAILAALNIEAGSIDPWDGND